MDRSDRGPDQTAKTSAPQKEKIKSNVTESREKLKTSNTLNSKINKPTK